MTSVTLYQCGSCRQVFADEAGIRAHQELWNKLREVDPEIDAHDGEPWRVFTLRDGDGPRGINDFYISVVGEGVCDGNPAPTVRLYGGTYCNRDVCVDVEELAWILTGSAPADEQKVRAFAAAFTIHVTVRHPEVDLRTHLSLRQMRWERSDRPLRFAEEVAYIQATLTMIQIESARRGQ